MERLETFLDFQQKFCDLIYNLRDNELKNWYLERFIIPIELVSKEGDVISVNVPIVNVSFVLCHEKSIQYPDALTDMYSFCRKPYNEEFLDEFKKEDLHQLWRKCLQAAQKVGLSEHAYQLSFNYRDTAEIYMDQSNPRLFEDKCHCDYRNSWCDAIKEREYSSFSFSEYKNITKSKLFFLSNEFNHDRIKDIVTLVLQKTNCDNKIPNINNIRTLELASEPSPLIRVLTPIGQKRDERHGWKWKGEFSALSPTGTIPVMCFFDAVRIISTKEFSVSNKYFQQKCHQQESMMARINAKQKEKIEQAIAEKRKQLLEDFNYVNRHQRDGALVFDSTSHSYRYHGTELLSVTDFIASFFPVFNEKEKAKEISDKTGRSIDSILREWKEASDNGILLHKSIDAYYHKKQVNSSQQDYKLFLEFVEKNHLNPYRTEWSIYDEDAEVIGAIDLLDYSDGRFTLYDWKRSKNLVGSEGAIKHNRFETRMGYYPINDIEDLPFWHYALQQNLYRYILGKKYGIDVKRMKLVVLHPSLEHPIIIDIPNMTDSILKIINTRL